MTDHREQAERVSKITRQGALLNPGRDSVTCNENSTSARLHALLQHRRYTHEENKRSSGCDAPKKGQQVPKNEVQAADVSS